jgi:hypothetical protein
LYDVNAGGVFLEAEYDVHFFPRGSWRSLPRAFYFTGPK